MIFWAVVLITNILVMFLIGGKIITIPQKLYLWVWLILISTTYCVINAFSFSYTNRITQEMLGTTKTEIEQDIIDIKNMTPNIYTYSNYINRLVSLKDKIYRYNKMLSYSGTNNQYNGNVFYIHWSLKLNLINHHIYTEEIINKKLTSEN